MSDEKFGNRIIFWKNNTYDFQTELQLVIILINDYFLTTPCVGLIYKICLRLSFTRNSNSYGSKMDNTKTVNATCAYNFTNVLSANT